MDNYIVYHLHTELSLLDSCTNYKLYIDKAKELGMKAIGFSEHGNIYNYIEKKMYCDEMGIKYLHGCEVYLTEQLEPKIRDNYHTILISRNEQGFKELNMLIDMSTQSDHFYYKPRITFDEFLNISDNIIKISACLSSPLSKLSKDNPYYHKLAQKYDFYEIQPWEHSEQSIYNNALYMLSKEYNKPLISGSDTHSLDKYKAECRSILQKAKEIDYTYEDSFDLTFKSCNEFVQLFDNQNSLPKEVYLQAINNTNLLYDMCEDLVLDTTYKYPKLYENDEKMFEQTVINKLKEKLNNGVITKENLQKYIKNVKEETRVFKKIGMCSFMLFMSELCTWCKNNDIPIGYCRGSVGGSTVAYVLDIIDLDPIQWNTVFSRFANEDRIEIGDIDIDFAPQDREKVYEYIINRFGFEYTAYILAIGTIVDKGTIDEIGRALNYMWLKENAEGVKSGVINKGDSPYSLSAIENIKKEYAENPLEAKASYPDIFYYFDGLLNTAISQSIHPAGIVVSPLTLQDNFGTFWNDGKRIMQINMEEIHEINLVKYDILGLKNIGVIKDTYKLIGSRYLNSIEINWNDLDVWNDIVTSPVGIFQFESPYAFSLLERYKPTKINDLSLINASLRPSGTSYRDKLITREFNHNPSEQIDELLKDNNGFLVFQEDTIKFLVNICGFSGSEADNIRRAIGRKQKERLEKALPKILEGYCRVSPKPTEVAEQEAKAFLQIIEDSSSYQFGYNHSTGYSMIGYTCGYLRYHHPIEFVTAFLNNAQNEADIKDGTELAKLKNIKIVSPKFRYSSALYMPNNKDNSIYKGVASIKYLNNQVAEELYNLGKNDYSTFVDLLIDIAEKTSVNTRQMEILIKLDYFQEFGNNRQLLTIYNQFDKRYKKTHKDKTKIQRIAELKEFETNCNEKPFSLDEKMRTELEYLGYIETKVPTIPKDYCMVTDVVTKYTHPMVALYHINDGSIETIKVKNGLYNDNKFEPFDIIRVVERVEDYKWMKVGKEWKRSTNKEWLLKRWNIIK